MKKTLLAALAALTITLGSWSVSAWMRHGMMISGNGKAPQIIAAIAPLNLTFTNNTPNATVGVFTVTMHPASPAFSGTFSLTGANSGGFHLVGATLQTNAAGTTSGTYNDVTVVATQAGIVNSPQQITPTIVGSGGGGTTVCDIGPNYTGTIPSTAQAMGYTHCRANYDFRNSFFTTLSNWLGCTDDGTTFHYFWLENEGASAVPCNQINMISDGGVQTLDLTFTVADFNAGRKIMSLNTTSFGGNPTPVGTKFPNGLYLDSVYRLPNPTMSNVSTPNPSGVNMSVAPWFYGLGLTASPQTNVMEWDSGEIAGGSTPYQSSNVGEHCPDSAGGFSCKFGQLYYMSRDTRWDPTTYHHWGYLAAVDSGHYEECSYIDGTPALYAGGGSNGCLSDTFFNGVGDTALTSNNLMKIWFGSGTPSDSCGGPTCQAPLGNLDAYFQQIVVWTCPPNNGAGGWNNGCAVANIPSSPP